ncbi:hypothetical protein [Cecembia calidifontis]|uniref:hypothetical protein n=1 Tax=Cecembia calidifontis TaxID=1187080 RepID=UPI001029E97C|nr:hypothetical protein [Cecembia calidifontis]
MEFEEYAYSILICKDSTLFKKIDQASFPNPQGSLKVRAGSLSFHKIGTESFELSENKFLRKVSREIYVLNRKDSIIWQVNPIIIGPLKKIDVLYLSDDNVHNSYLQYLGKFIFLDVGFTKEELLQRINEGLFDNYYRTYHRSKKRYTTYSVFVKNKEVSKGEVNDEME